MAAQKKTLKRRASWFYRPMLKQSRCARLSEKKCLRRSKRCEMTRATKKRESYCRRRTSNRGYRKLHEGWKSGWSP